MPQAPTCARLRKAYEITVANYPPYIVFAPTPGKARAEAIRNVQSAWGCSWKEAMSEVRSVHRALERDVRLPDRHPLAPQLPPAILHNVTHAFGGTGLRAGYRDHFYASEDDWEMRAGLYHGLFKIHRRDKGRDGQPDMILYALTALGRNVARGEQQLYERV